MPRGNIRAARGLPDSSAEPLESNMHCVNLIAHPATPCLNPQHIRASITKLPMALKIQFAVDGDIGKLPIPMKSSPRRVDNLWQHTCFEAFIAAPCDESYLEFNFAPSGEWAIYRFDSYRQGMKAIGTTAPIIATRRMAQNLSVAVSVALSSFADLKNHSDLRVGLSAVIEDSDGGLSYWALTHPPGKPDFHHRDSFALTLDQLKNST